MTISTDEIVVAIVAILGRRKKLSTFELIDALRERFSLRLREERVLEVLAQRRGTSFDRAETGDWVLAPPRHPFDLNGELKRCTKLYADGQYAHAAQVAKRICDHSPRHPKALMILGHCHFKLGNYRKSVTALWAAISLDPSHTTAWETLAQSLDRLGKPAEAATVLATLTAKLPNDVGPWRERCRLLYQTGG